MRDNLCNEEYLNESIEDNLFFLEEKEKKIKSLQEDIINGIQRFPLPPEEIIKKTRESTYRIIADLISIKYSLGCEVKELEELYLKGIDYISDIGYECIGYVNMLQYVSIGILLEIPKVRMDRLFEVINEERVDDVLLDYLACSCGIQQNVKSSNYQKKNPYSHIMSVVETAQSNKHKAAEMLSDYIENQWLQGHADYGWTTFHKEPGYYGLWSFEAGAVAKILNLDDENLRDSNHYPYDLVHYKNSFVACGVSYNSLLQDEKEEPGEGIEENVSLEKIIPRCFHKCVNQIICDYNNLSSRALWEKYNLNQIWFNEKQFEDENKGGLLGFLIVNLLVKEGYILQIDYKEDVTDYVDSMDNYWNEDNVTMVQFIIDNDQKYYAKVPANIDLIDLYEVRVRFC